MSARIPSRGAAARRFACLVTALATLCSSAAVVADDHEPEVFRYRNDIRPYPLRGALEVAGLLGLGAALYFTTNDLSSDGWEYEYTVQDFGLKLREGYVFDSNRFDTNYLGHPGSGTLYYWAARGNRLSVAWSFAYTLMASILWEVFGELRERVSLNDMLVTPIGGLALGEATVQLGAFFDRSCPSTTNSVFGTAFGLSKSLHDWIDGAQLARDSDCDRYGLTRRGDHEFRISLGGGAVFSTAGSNAAPFPEARLDLRTRVIALRAYGRPGRGSRTFADGNWTEVWGAAAFAKERLGNYRVGADLVPIGVHVRDIAPAASGAGLIGDEMVFGLLVGAEYIAHRFQGGQPPGPDRAFLLNVPGLALRYRVYAGSLRVDAEFKASPTFGGIEALALPAYLREHEGSIEGLARNVAVNGYDHAVGFMLAPRLRVTVPSLEIGADLQAVQLWAVHTFDGAEGRIDVVDALQRANLWVAFGPLVANLWLRLWGAAVQRWGSVADTQMLRAELRTGVAIDAVY